MFHQIINEIFKNFIIFVDENELVKFNSYQAHIKIEYSASICISSTL